MFAACNQRGKASPTRLLLLLVWAFILPASLGQTYDYVIVGGGAIGLSLAVRLSEDPTQTVAVLEAGGTYVSSCSLTFLVLSFSTILGDSESKLV